MSRGEEKTGKGDLLEDKAKTNQALLYSNRIVMSFLGYQKRGDLRKCQAKTKRYG